MLDDFLTTHSAPNVRQNFNHHLIRRAWPPVPVRKTRRILIKGAIRATSSHSRRMYKQRPAAVSFGSSAGVAGRAPPPSDHPGLLGKPRRSESSILKIGRVRPTGMSSTLAITAGPASLLRCDLGGGLISLVAQFEGQVKQPGCRGCERRWISSLRTLERRWKPIGTPVIHPEPSVLPSLQTSRSRPASTRVGKNRWPRRAGPARCS